MLKNFTFVIRILIFVFAFGGTFSAFADKKEDIQKEQQAVLEMRDEALADLYKGKPEAKEKIKKAAGYAVFDNAGIHLLLLATSRGNGVAVNNKTAKNIYMKMKTVGAGPGLGVKDYRVVFIFAKAATLKKFTESGWSFSGEADAAAKTKKEGGAASAAGTSSEGIEIYTITKKGVAFQATLGGTKFSRDDDLNVL
jgi:lipid-binding SYLF domain-containing protein